MEILVLYFLYLPQMIDCQIYVLHTAHLCLNHSPLSCQLFELLIVKLRLFVK